MALWDDDGDLKILAMQSNPQKKGLGRKALNILMEEGLVGRPVTIRPKAEKFWGKMCSEGLAVENNSNTRNSSFVNEKSNIQKSRNHG
jgi:hypothetical protein